MPFEKGHTLGEGRPRGSQNKKTKEWIALGVSIRNKHAKRFNQVLSSLDDVEFIKAYTGIVKYFEPAQLKQDIDQKQIIEYKNVSKEYPDE